MTALSFFGLVAFATRQSDMLDPETENSEIHWLAAVICVNMAACILLLFALAVVRLVFGELRAQELNAAKDKFWNFVFYKVRESQIYNLLDKNPFAFFYENRSVFFLKVFDHITC